MGQWESKVGIFIQKLTHHPPSLIIMNSTSYGGQAARPFAGRSTLRQAQDRQGYTGEKPARPPKLIEWR
jgi:hypothetical protein